MTLVLNASQQAQTHTHTFLFALLWRGSEQCVFGKVKQLTHLWPLGLSQSLLRSADEMSDARVTASTERPVHVLDFLCHGGGVSVPRCYVGVT